MKNLLPLIALACSAVFTPAAQGAGTPANNPNEPFVFSVVSDIHCDSYNTEAQSKFANALQDAHSVGARDMIVAGDSSDGLDKDYKTVRAIVDSSPLSGAVYFAMGNHEYYRAFHDGTGAWNADAFPNGQTDPDARGKFNSFRGANASSPVYYDEWLGGYHFIFLAGEASRMTNRDYKDDAMLSHQQLAWLKASLEKTPQSEPVFIFLHQPFPNTVAGSADGEISIRPAEELKALLAAHPSAIMFSGHSHYSLSQPNTFYTDASYNFPMFNCSSVWQPWADGKALPGNGSEGLIVYVDKDSVTVKGRDFKNASFIADRTYNLKRLPKMPAKDGKDN